MKILDSHSHYLPEEIRKFASFYPPVWSQEENLLGFIGKNEIEKSVLLYPTTDAYKKLGAKQEASIYNQALAKFCAKYPDKFIPAFIVPQDTQENMLEEAGFALNSLGFKAVSLPSSYQARYLDDQFYAEFFGLLNERSAVIFIHSQTQSPIGTERFFDPLLTPVMQYLFDLSACLGKLIMSGALNKFPNLKFVFAHFGGVLPILAKRFDTTYAMLRGINVVKDLGDLPGNSLKRFYVDTSGVSSLNVLNCAREVFGDSNILWGSDYPANKDAVQSLEMLKQLSGGGQMLGGNLGRILNIK